MPPTPTPPQPAETRIRPRLGSRRSRVRLVAKDGWPAFGTYLGNLLAKRDLTITELAERIGCDGSMLSKVISGYCPIPTAALTGKEFRAGKWWPAKTKLWAKALKLDKDESAEFEATAWLSRAPAPVIERVRGLEAEVVHLKGRLQAQRPDRKAGRKA